MYGVDQLWRKFKHTPAKIAHVGKLLGVPEVAVYVLLRAGEAGIELPVSELEKLLPARRDAGVPQPSGHGRPAVRS